MTDVCDSESTIARQMASRSECSTAAESHSVDGMMTQPEVDLPKPRPNLKPLNIGLLSFHHFAEDCLMKALEEVHPHTSMSSFMTVKDLTARASKDLDFLMYYLHGPEPSDPAIMQTISAICGAFPTVPLIVFSDAESEQQPRLMRATMKSGARGFIPTQTAGLSITMAAIDLVNAGGTFVPADLMLPTRTDPERKGLLTSRQKDVLAQLQQGKANKIIAYDLGMSESTVKIHVRNIMRKMGATNRTQAVYKAMHEFSTTARSAQ